MTPIENRVDTLEIKLQTIEDKLDRILGFAENISNNTIEYIELLKTVKDKVDRHEHQLRLVHCIKQTPEACPIPMVGNGSSQ